MVVPGVDHIAVEGSCGRALVAGISAQLQAKPLGRLRLKGVVFPSDGGVLRPQRVCVFAHAGVVENGFKGARKRFKAGLVGCRVLCAVEDAR
jgi:hypothetical protein